MLFLKGNQMDKHSKEPGPVVVLFPFRQEAIGECLRRSAEVLRQAGQPVDLLFWDSLTEGERGPFHLLAFVKTLEETGQLALKASSMGISGDVVYGGTDFGVSLARRNVITTFGNGHFQSTLVQTGDWAFPAISDRDLAEGHGNPMVERTLSLVYTGLMIHSAGRRDSFLSAMDEGRRLWRKGLIPGNTGGPGSR
jgi:hypothetical protein